MNTKEYNQEIKKLKEGISNLKEENKLLKEQKKLILIGNGLISKKKLGELFTIWENYNK